MQVITIKVLGTASILTVCTLLALFVLNRFENPTNTFADYSEMAASQTMAAGWIPKIIPRSAYDISETHNLDNNRFRLTFKFEPGDHEVASRTCQLAVEQETEFVYFCPDGTLRLATSGQGSFESD